MVTASQSLSLISRSAEETFLIGKIIADNLCAGDILALTGELGAGKTCLTQGIARGLGVSESYQITSPTFTLVNEYESRLKLYHLDLYRLNDSTDMNDICIEEFLYSEGVCVIEWAEKITKAFPDKVIYVSLGYLDEDRRRILISGDGVRVAQFSHMLKSGGF
jgi:tRNA threonylcarbamoyladenosine biosynthesis protein TsaE